MAHLIPAQRTLLNSSIRSRLSTFQQCSIKPSRQSVRTSILSHALDLIYPEAIGHAPEETKSSTSNDEKRVNAPQKPERSRATHWDGLEWVGSRKYIWENTRSAQTERWAPGEAVSIDELQTQLLCALVETLLVYNGESSPDYDMKTLPLHDESHFFNLFPSGIAVGPNPNSKAGFPQLAISSAHRNAILHQQQIPSEESTGTDSGSAQEESMSYKSWQEVPLQPLSMRFAFLKRVFQRTGHRIPDSTIAKCRKAGDLSTILRVQRNATRKLAQELEDGGAFGLKHRSNVDFKPKRVTRIDKDMTVGRWKLTREQLAKAGLPEFWAATLPPLNERRRMTVQPRRESGRQIDVAKNV